MGLIGMMFGIKKMALTSSSSSSSGSGIDSGSETSDSEDAVKDQESKSKPPAKEPVKLDLHNDASGVDGVDKSHAKSEEAKNIDTEFLEEDLQDDWTESSVSVSEKSANAPIRNKKVPFGLIRKILKNNQDSVTSVRGSNDKDTVKENMTEKQNELDLHNDLAPGEGTNEVDKSHDESEEPEDNDTDFLEEDLQYDWTESSASASKKSAHAPIGMKKVAGLAVLLCRQILKGSQLSKFALQDTYPSHNDLATSADTNGVHKSLDKSEDPEDIDIDTEFLEEDLQDDWTESSASVSEKSANALYATKKSPSG